MIVATDFAARRSSLSPSARCGASTTATRSRLKKVLHAAEQDRPDVAAARNALKAEQPALVASHLVFIDETEVTTKMTRLYGRPAGPAVGREGPARSLENASAGCRPARRRRDRSLRD